MRMSPTPKWSCAIWCLVSFPDPGARSPVKRKEGLVTSSLALILNFTWAKPLKLPAGLQWIGSVIRSLKLSMCGQEAQSMDHSDCYLRCSKHLYYIHETLLSHIRVLYWGSGKETIRCFKRYMTDYVCRYRIATYVYPSGRCVWLIYHIVLDKCPWALVAQVSKIEGGQLHGGGAWMVQLSPCKRPPQMQS